MPGRSGYDAYRRRYPYRYRAIAAAAKGTAFAIRNKGAIAAAAASMLASRMKRGGPIHYGLSGEGYKGGAAPIKGKSYRKRGRRKPRYTKSNTKLTKEVASLRKQVVDLKHSENASLGKLTYRKYRAQTMKCNANEQASSRFEVNRTTEMEGVLAQLLYYNPSAPATLVTADGTSGTYQKQFLFKSVYSKLLLRNNYQVDVEVIVYLAKPKVDTSINSSTALTNAIADDAGNVTASTQFGVFPNDFDTFRDLWTLKRVASKDLCPGQSTEVSHSEKDIFYDPALTDSHSLAYQKGFKNFGWFVLIRGTVGHDTAVLGEEGTMQCGVDIMQQDNFVVEYDAGVNLSYIYVDNTLDTPTNGFVQSQKPVADNLAYSLA